MSTPEHLQQQIDQLRTIISGLSFGPSNHEIDVVVGKLKVFGDKLSELEASVFSAPTVSEVETAKGEAVAAANRATVAMLRVNLPAAVEPLIDELISIEKRLDRTLGQVANDMNTAKAAAVALPVSAADALLSMAHHHCHSTGA